jgi:hypothetical protein
VELDRTRRDVEAVRAADGVKLAPAVDFHLHAVDLAVHGVVEAEEIAGTEAAQVDAAAEFAVQQGALAAIEATAFQHAVERVVGLDGEEHRMFGEGGVGRGARSQVLIAQLRRRNRGSSRLCRGRPGRIDDGDRSKDEWDGQRKHDREVRPRPPYHPTQSFA